MYKNLVWFAAGYLTCKHLVPIAHEVVARWEREAAS